MSFESPIPSLVSIADGANLDAFGRLITSTPQYIFDSQFTYNLQTLLFEQTTSGSGATITHDTTNRCAKMTFSSTPTGGKAYMQSFEYFRYQPGRGQKILITFNFNELVTGVLKFAGYGDGTNGIALEANGTDVRFKIFSGTTLGNQTVSQSAWNLDQLNGQGPSRVTLDLTKVQILVIDLQALYVGRVRVGFDIGGQLIWAHQFKHANVVAFPYIQDANCPIRVGMTCTATVSTTMLFVCCSVISNSGDPKDYGLSFTIGNGVTAASGARTHLVSLRPALTFNSIVNRVGFRLDSVIVSVAGANQVLWELCIGDVLTGTTTFNDVNATYSAFQYNTAGTTSGAPAIVIESGYLPAASGAKTSVALDINSRYPITLNGAGAVRALGQLTLLVTAFTGTSLTYATLNWREVR